MKPQGLYIVVIWLWSMAAYAQQENKAVALQPVGDSLLQLTSYSQRLSINSFLTQNSVNGQWSRRAGSQIFYSLSNDWLYNTALVENPFVTRNQNFFLQHDEQLKPWWHIGGYTYLQDYAANNTQLLYAAAYSRFVKKINRHQLTGRTELGAASDKRLQARDNGLYYLLHGQHRFSDTLNQLDTRTTGHWTETRISPRLNQFGHLSAVLNKGFGKQAALFEGRTLLADRRTEDYIVESVQQINSDTTGAGISFNYQISDKLTLSTQNDWTRAKRSFNYRPFADSLTPRSRQSIFFEEDNFDLLQSASWQPGRFQISGQFRVRQRRRAYGIENNKNLNEQAFERVLMQEKIKDIEETFTSWQYDILWRATKKHQFETHTQARLIRVNTPSEENTQDRDEVLYGAETAWTARWNNMFSTTLKTSGNYKQFVFIKAAQSIENFQERAIRLEPAFTFTTQKIRWTGLYSLWATYQVRDSPAAQDKNRSNRIFITQQQVNWFIVPQQQINIDFIRRESRLGELNWESFTERPLDTTIVYDATIEWQKNQLAKKQGLTLHTGYRVFSQIQKRTAGQQGDINNTISLSSYIVQHGPQIKVSKQGKSLQVAASCWFQIYHAFNQYEVIDDLPFIGLSYATEDLDREQQNFYPFFEIRIGWVL